MRAVDVVVAAALALSLAGGMREEVWNAEEDGGRDIGAHQSSSSSQWSVGDEMTCGALTFKLGDEVAAGQYGAVYKIQGDPSRAVKIAFNPKQGTEAEIEGFKHECGIMQRLQGHAHVPQCHTWCAIAGDKGPTEALVMDFIADAVSLKTAKHEAKKKDGKYNWKEIGKQTYQSLLGMLSQGVTNTDQTSNNIVVDGSSKVYFIDMGKAVAEETYPDYCLKAKREKIILDEEPCGLLRIWQYIDTTKLVLGALQVREVCPKGSAKGAAECEAAAAQVAAGVSEAFCEDKSKWPGFRFVGEDRAEWCRYIGTQRRKGARFRYDSTCEESESFTYLLWDAERGVQLITDPSAGSVRWTDAMTTAKKGAAECFRVGGAVADADVDKLPKMLWDQIPAKDD